MKPKRKPTRRSTLFVPFAAIFVLLGIASANADYPELILSNNPAAYYRLEELPGATIAVDSSPNHFDATYVYNSGTTSPALGNPGITTNSAGFSGGTTGDKGFVLIPYHSELNPQMPDLQHGAPFSVECWVQATTQPSDYSVPLASFGRYNDPAPFGNASGWNIYQTPGPNSSWIFNLKTVGFFNWSGAIELLKWYHLVFTFDGSAGYFYINGVQASSAGGITAYLANPSYDGQIAAGDNVGFLPFVGGVDEVAFYTNALSLANVVAHYQLGTNSLRSPPTPPGFLQQPSSRTSFHGTTVSFSTVVSGTQPVTYQWYRGESPIPNATNSSYSLTATYPADDGAEFSVAVTNIVGGTNSAVATLTVLTDLNILNQPYGPIIRNVGSKAAFRVVATGAVPITYQWYKVKAGVTNLIANATSDTLWLSSLQLLDDQSEYYAHLTGPFTSVDSASAQLLVQARPVTVPITGYARVVTADDPVAYWRLDEADGSSTATDAVGSFDGAYTAGAGTLTYQAPGGIPAEPNKAINVDLGARVVVPYALELNAVSGPWSVEAWLSPGANSGVFRTPLSSMYVVPGSIKGWNIYQHDGSYWTMNMFGGGTGGSFNSDLFDHPLVPGAWYHLVISDDLSVIRFFVNGVQRSSTSRNNFVPNGLNGDASIAGGATVLGHRGDSEFSPWFGGIDDVAVYNYALTEAQAKNHFLNSTRLTAARAGGNIQLTWPVGTLQASSEVGGVYTNVTGATSPHSVPATETKKFFRVQVQP